MLNIFAPELEDEGMEFMDGICKTRECAWDVLLSESMKDQEATVEGAIHSIRNMGDVAFVILRKKEGLFRPYMRTIRQMFPFMI